MATHRLHHQNSDKEGDPHSPRDGGFWAHVGWIMTGDANAQRSGELLPYVPDLRKDTFSHLDQQMALGSASPSLGVVAARRRRLAATCCWGIFLRTVVELHGTWLVNSATHMWGTRRFVTPDDSTNNWWVAMLTFGEGWHNNHHAHPQCGAARSRLVRDRPELVRNLRAAGARPRLGRGAPALCSQPRVPTVIPPRQMRQELLRTGRAA